MSSYTECAKRKEKTTTIKLLKCAWLSRIFCSKTSFFIVLLRRRRGYNLKQHWDQFFYSTHWSLGDSIKSDRYNKTYQDKLHPRVVCACAHMCIRISAKKESALIYTLLRYILRHGFSYGDEDTDQSGTKATGE